MNLEHLRTHPLGRPTGPGWRVLTKFRALLLWFGGVHLGSNMTLIAWGFADGRSLASMVAPLLGCVVAVMFVAMALVWSPRPEDYEAGDES